MIEIKLHCSQYALHLLQPVVAAVFEGRLGQVRIVHEDTFEKPDWRVGLALLGLSLERRLLRLQRWLNPALLEMHRTEPKSQRLQRVSIVWCRSPMAEGKWSRDDWVVLLGARGLAQPYWTGLSEVVKRKASASAWVAVRYQGVDVFSRSLSTPTLATWSATQQLVLRKALGLVAWILSTGREAPDPKHHEVDLIPCGDNSTGREQHAVLALAYIGLALKRVAVRGLTRLLKGRRAWHVRVANDIALASLGQVAGDLLPNPSGCFWADPFVLVHEGRHYIFVEEYSSELARGQIVALSMGKDGRVVREGVCLLEPFHLSFPYVFQHDGRWWMCPESSESGQIRLYVCDEFPLRWRLHSTLMEGVSAADTVLFKYGVHWWMLTNIDSSLGMDHCSELHVFRTEDPFAGVPHWEPHHANPVVVDSNLARNGGAVIVDAGTGALLRVAQKQAYDVYGAGVTIREIVDLTIERYVERQIASIAPDKPYIGTHHLTRAGGVEVSDVLSG